MKETLIITEADPVIHGHRVHGQNVLPGLAYIDLLYQLFRDLGHDPFELELRDLTIYRPLTPGPGPGLRLEIGITAKGPDAWALVGDVVDLVPRGGRPPSASRVVTAEMHRVGRPTFADRLDPVALHGDPASARALEETYAACRDRGLVHSGWMKPSGRVWEGRGENRVWVDGSGSEGRLDGFLFHPAVLDASGVAGRTVLPPSIYEGGGLILPFSIGSFRACAPVGDTALARVRGGDTLAGGDVAFLEIDLFDPSGTPVAQLRRFANKRVRGSSLAGSPVSSQTQSGWGPGPASTGGGGEVPGAAEGVALAFLRAILASRLGVTPGQVPVDSGYYEMGLDSVVILEATRAIEERVGAPVPPTVMFEHTTVGALALHLARRHPAAFLPGASVESVRVDPTGPASAGGPSAEGTEVQGMSGLRDTDIAVIGLAGRYPGAPDLGQFWENLVAGCDSVSEVPVERWNWNDWAHLRSPSGKSVSRWGGFLEGVDAFDAGFFRISPREAAAMDPQERLFLETCWSAIEDAGYTPEILAPAAGPPIRHRVGVFAGVMHHDYALLGLESDPGGSRQPLSLNLSSIANRVSYFCNFHGPSLVVDTACSSSLTAVHLAVESLRNGSCGVALAGGVNLSLHPLKYVTYGLMDMQSSDGRCRAFGADGDGYVSGEGVGVVVLKPLRRAVADGDPIRAVIRGSRLNHGGRAGGFTVPNPVAQAGVIAEAWRDAGIDPRTVTCVEAHGTGTSLGDPIEFEALVRAFQAHTGDVGFCALGSVKSNIGHAESAAGIAGLTKLVLQLSHGVLVPTLHAARGNPHLTLDGSPFRLPDRATVWRPMLPESSGQGGGVLPRRGVVSSFGAGGSNAHLVVEQAPSVAEDPSSIPPGAVLIPLSAQDRDRLREVVQRLLGFLERDGASVRLEDLAFTLQTGRRAFDERVAIIADSVGQLILRLRGLASGAEPEPGVHRSGDGTARGSSGQPGPWPAAEALARLWVQGETVDWPTSVAAVRGRRIPVPTYPFARTRHWLERRPTAPLPIGSSTSPQPGPIGDATLRFVPRWTVSPGGRASEAHPLPGPVSGLPHLFLVSGNRWFAEHLRGAGIVADVTAMAPDLDAADAVERATVEIFQWVRSLAGSADSRGRRLFVCAPVGDAGHPYRSLMGLLRSVAAESVLVTPQLILDAALDDGEIERFCDHLREEAARPGTDPEVLHDADGRRHVLTLGNPSVPVEGIPDAAGIRRGGVYWITGGMGGIGLLMARHLGTAFGARVILSGRSPLGRERTEVLERLRSEGIAVEYRACDVTEEAEVASTVGHILGVHGSLHGILHAAGILRDNYIARKTAEEIRDVLAPKVRAVVALDRATRVVPLDFMALFSSVASYGAVGQLDYAVANAFLDSFAEDRNRRAALGECRGRTVAIQWPLWKEGGMSPGAFYEEQMRRNLGMLPLPTDLAIEEFHAALRSGLPQWGVAHGNEAKLRSYLRLHPSGSVSEVALREAVPPASGVAPRGMVDPEEIVLSGIGRIFGLQGASIRRDRSLSDQGGDSVMLTELANHLNDALGCSLQGAAFFELDTPDRIVAHLRDWLRSRAGDPVSPIPGPVLGSVVSTDRVPVKESGPEPGTDRRVAIVGYDACLPGASDPDRFWERVLVRGSAISRCTGQTWAMRGVRVDGARTDSMQWAALLDGVFAFDPLFWGVEPVTAAGLDPQVRLLLGSLWRAAEAAGIPWSELGRQRVGLFVAVDSVDYRSVLRGQGATADLRSGLSPGMVANQVSYFANLRGPSESVDTACSSVFVALARAVQALRSGQCAMAFVAGTKLLMDPEEFEIRHRGGLLSPDGRLVSFDRDARGYVRGEGYGCFLLKPLDEARRDGDRIHALVSGIGISHNGHRALSSLAPDVAAQCEAMREAYAMAGIDPGAVGYLEANGAGTPFSDASELAAYRRFFKEALGPGFAGFRCPVSAVKPNVGHLEGASGLPSLLRAVLALGHRVIPPTAGFEEAHPSMFLKGSPFDVPRTAQDWPVGPGPRRVVGLHSIGIGGVNAHVVLEEGDPEPRVPAAIPPPAGPFLILLSSRSEPRLRRVFSDWRDRIAGGWGRSDPGWLHDVAQASRNDLDAMPWRAAFLVGAVTDLDAALARVLAGEMSGDSEGAWWRVATRAVGPGAAATAAVAGLPRDPRELRDAACRWIDGRVSAWTESNPAPRHARPLLPPHPMEIRDYCPGPLPEGMENGRFRGQASDAEPQKLNA